MTEKNTRKQKGQQWLAEWKDRTDGVTQQTLKIAQEEAAAKMSEQEKAKAQGNPWVYICNNCDLRKDGYKGDHDVSRLRDAMMSRRDDITKAGGMKKAK